MFASGIIHIRNLIMLCYRIVIFRCTVKTQKKHVCKTSFHQLSNILCISHLYEFILINTYDKSNMKSYIIHENQIT